MVLATLQLTLDFFSQVPVSLPNRPHWSLGLYGPQPWIQLPQVNCELLQTLEQASPIRLAPTWHGSALSSLQTWPWKNSRKHPKLFSQENQLFKFRKTEKFQFFWFCLSLRKFQYLIFLQILTKNFWKSFPYKMEILHFSQLIANQLHNKALVRYFL